MVGLDLRKPIVGSYWKARDVRLHSILRYMETTESWVLDSDEDFSQALEKLAARLDKADRQAVLKNADRLLLVMAYMSSSSAMRTLTWLDQHFQNGLSVDLLRLARESDEPATRIILDRVRAIHSLSLLGQVFSPERLRLVSDVLRETDDDLHKGAPRTGLI